MKKFLYLLFICCSLNLWGQQVDLDKALKTAENFYVQKNIQKSKPKLKLYCTIQNATIANESQTTDFYVFTNEEKGFVIVSGEMRTSPIIAYSTENNFDTTDMPENIRWWLQSYQQQINYIRNNVKEDKNAIHPDWELYSYENVVQTKKTNKSVSPLVNTTWNQRFPYYNLCPYDNNKSAYCVTGCVATAMAQILKFWNYPARGTGNHSYNHPDYGTLSANFGNTTYQWSSMTNSYSNNSTQQEQNAVATLMYHCGVSVNMDYSPESSGAITLMSDDAVEYYGYYDARTALMRYFGCDTVIGYYRDYYDSATWVNMLKNELNIGHPILYAGTGSAGGHAFVCDGYDNDYYFHMNWGWGGSSDGYFLISLLNPSSLGTGGGAGGFNTNQRALFVTAYTDTNTYNLRLDNYLTTTDTIINADTNFSISATVYNSGKPIECEIGLAIYKSNGVFVDYMDVKSNQTLNSNTSTKYTFSSSNFLNLTKGRYFAVVCYKANTSNRWKAVENGNYNNQLYFNIVSDENFILQMYSQLRVSDNPVNYNTNFNFTDSIVNWGEETFTGYITVAIYQNNDSLVYLNAPKQISLGSYYFISLVFNINASSTLHSGDYYARVLYSTDNQKWKIIDEGSFTNKLSFSVTGRDLSLNKALTCNRDTIAYMEPFSISTNVKNNSPAVYKGNFAIFAFDQDGAFIDTIGILTNVTVSARKNKELSFPSDGMSTLKKGRTYIASLFYIDEYGNWTKIEGGNYSNHLDIIVGGLDIEIKVNSLEISSNPIPYLSNFNFKASVFNAGYDTYHGAFKIFIYNSSNENIYSTDSIPYDLNYNTTLNLTYNLSSISALTTGDYRATIKYLEDNQWVDVPNGNTNSSINFSVKGTGIAEADQTGMQPFPNPAHDFIYLNLPKETNVSLTDASGRVIFQSVMQGENVRINLQNYSKGIYLIRLTTNDGTARSFTITKQ